MTPVPTQRLVLVIDADGAFTDDARQLLADERVRAVRSIEEAAEIVAAERVDLVLLGPSLGNESAVLSAGLLREADPGLGVVLVANIVTNRILLAALRSGLLDVVDTPLTDRKLAGIIQRIPGPRDTETVDLDAGPAFAVGGLSEGYVGEEPFAGSSVLVAVEASSGLSTPVSFIADEGSDSSGAEPGGWAAPLTSDARAAERATPSQTPDAWPIHSVEDRETATRDWPADAPGAGRPAPATEPEDENDPDEDAPLPPPLEYVAPSRASLLPLPETPRTGDTDAAEAEEVEETQDPSSPGSSHVVAVVAGHAGAGRTTTASNLAAALATQRGEGSVALVDADLLTGDLAVMLHLDPLATLADAVEQLDGLSDEHLDGMLLQHGSGVRVLPAPRDGAAAAGIAAKGVVAVLERLRGMYPTIVVDTPTALDDHLVTLLEAADEVLVVVDRDLSSVRSARSALEHLRADRYPMERVRLVVNRGNGKPRLDPTEVAERLEVPVVGSIPADRSIPKAAGKGIPAVALRPRSPAARSFRELAGRIGMPESDGDG